MTDNAKLNTNQALMDRMVSFAQTTYPESGEIMPMWTLIDAEGGAHVFMTPFSSQQEKEIVSLMIRAMVIKHNAVRLGFMSETWIASAEGMSEEEARNIVPSEQPNRREAVLFMIEDRDGGGMSGMCEIKRNADGKGILQPFEGSTLSHTQGRFANFFPQKERVLH